MTSQTYSIHQCVHDWTLNSLNETIDQAVYWYAFDCVFNLIPTEEWELFGQLQYASLAPHALRLTHSKFQSIVSDIKEDKVGGALWIGYLLTTQIHLDEAEQMYVRALTRCEKTFKPNHIAAITLINNLSLVYLYQGKLDKAEKMYVRALAGHEKVFGPNHTSTLLVANKLGRVYLYQGKLDEAHKMYTRALVAYERDQESSLTLETVYNLGVLYVFQGKPDKAEQMLVRALAGYEKALGSEHTSTLQTAGGLGILYHAQGKLYESETMLERAHVGMNKALGQDHHCSLMMTIDRANLCVTQGKQLEAKEFYVQASIGCARILSHTKKPPEALIDRYAEALCNSIRIGGSTAIAQNQLVDLIHHVRKRAAGDVFVAQWLAKALMSLGDDRNARLAIVHSIEGRSEMLDFGGTPCSGCFRRITTDMGLHVCRECIGVNLCDSCFSVYTDNTLNLPTCCEHRFCDFGVMVRETDWSDGWGERGFSAWISKLIAQYPAIGDRQMYIDE